MIRHLVDDLARALKKDVASCENPRGGASILRSEGVRMGDLLPSQEGGAPKRCGNLPEGNI